MSRLCFTFQNIADRTWHAIADAYRAGLSYGEETITETNLLHLNRYHPKQIRIKAFSKRKEEPATGADWEWWIGGRGRWLGMRVQAKKIKYPGDDFGKLQTYTTPSKTKPQIDMLINQAKADRLNPAYCLYVSSQTLPPIWTTTCCWYYPKQFHMGCLIGHAVALRATGSNKLNDLAHVCLPWHCLVCDCTCCPPSGSRPSGGSLANAAFALIKNSRIAGGEYGGGDLDGYKDFPLFEPQQSLPDYLGPLLADEWGDGSDERLRGIAEERGLSGFVILQDEQES